MKRYSIMARPYGADHEVEICQCDSHPEELAEGVRLKRIMMQVGDRKVPIGKYEHVYFVDHEEETK